METKDRSDHFIDLAPPIQIEMDANDGDNAGLLELPKTTVDPEKIRPTREELEKELERIGKEIKKLKRFSNAVKYIFRNEWEEKTEEWKAKKLEFRELRKKEADLEGTLEVLKKSVREIGGKDDEIRKLKEKIAKLEEVREMPVPNATEGQGKEVSKSKGKDAVAILPEEIWRMILGNVSDPNDLWSCYNTCPLFAELLHDWKTNWVFEQTLPYFYRHLHGPALLKCRTICSGWLATVDNLLEDHPSLRPYSDSPSADPQRLELVNPLKQTQVGWRNEYTFTNDGNVPLKQNPDIQDFPCRNVFVGRNVILNIGREAGNEDGGGQRLWGRVYKFLTTFGKDIWYLNISFPHRGSEQFTGNVAQRKVVQFLTIDLFLLVPNLRKLTIQETPGVTSIPAHQAYPPAIHLETVHVVFKVGDPDQILISLLSRYHTQLHRLHLKVYEWDVVCALGWPNLSELHLEEDIFINDFDSLQGDGTPQLRKLGLRMCLDTFPEYVDFLTSFHELISTKPLSALRLEINFWIDPVGRDDDGNFNEFIEVLETSTDFNLCVSPTLKTIEIGHDGMKEWARSYNFLLRFFPLIENLHVFQRRTPKGTIEEFRNEIDLSVEPRAFVRSSNYKSGEEMLEINKYAYGGEMYKSNIWELFPRLKVFTFQWDVYTRGGYEAYLESIKTF